MTRAAALMGLLLGVGGPFACFTGDGLRGQPCRTDADCNALGDLLGVHLTCVDESCRAPCGSGLEECNDGNDDSTDACVDCRLAICGDGVVRADSDEECDDGNAVDTDACLPTCVAAKCGDGKVQAGVEECDDGNADNSDGCVDCRLPTCGDGHVWVGHEACEEGDPDCAGCQSAVCGNGIVNPLVEACDDGNAAENDGCNAACELGAERIAAGFAARHTCALRADGVRCWGANSGGQLGVGHRASVGDEKSDLPPADTVVAGDVTAVAVGNAHTCALLAEGADGSNVRCWGSNDGGVLGLPGVHSVGDAEDDELDEPVLVGGRAVYISAGHGHTCAVLDGGAVRCWGSNLSFVLGQPALAETAVVGDDEAPASLEPVALGGPARTVAAGLDFTCALLVDGAVRCWGSNEYGQLGLADSFLVVGDDETPAEGPPVPIGGVDAVQIAAGGRLGCAVRSDGEVWCWGGLNDPEPVRIALDAPATQVAAGDVHGCAVLATGGVHCWGNNEENQLGLGAGPVDVGGTPVAIAAGERHTCALLDGGVIRCWGGNLVGELGRGHTRRIGDTADELPPAPSGIYHEL